MLCTFTASSSLQHSRSSEGKKKKKGKKSWHHICNLLFFGIKADLSNRLHTRVSSSSSSHSNAFRNLDLIPSGPDDLLQFLSPINYKSYSTDTSIWDSSSEKSSGRKRLQCVYNSPYNPLPHKEIDRNANAETKLSQMLLLHLESNLFGKDFISSFYVQSLISWSSISEADFPVSFLHSTSQNSCPFLVSLFYDGFLLLKGVFLLLVIIFGLKTLAFPSKKTPLFLLVA